jgi:hypothetical protein
MTDAEIDRCLGAVVDDAGMLDIAELFGGETARKNGAFERSE